MMKNETKEKIWNWVFIIGILLVFVAGGIAYEEWHGAKKFCENIDGHYTLKVFPLPIEHSCNNQTLIRYSDTWDFSRTELGNINLTIP